MIFCISNTYFDIDTGYEMETGWQKFKSSTQQNKVAFVCNPLRFQTINRDIAYAGNQKVENIFLANQEYMLCDESYQHAYTSTTDKEIVSILLAYLYYTHAIQKQIIKLHCSMIDDCGRGILFLGPSGIGKTTQAERWAECRGSTIINGDVGFVERTKDGYLAWGTPWHGSSSYCLNMSVPIKALVVLKQAPENQLRELNGFEKVMEVSEHVCYPTWLENGIELCTEVLNHLLNDLPVYRLDNRADEEAVQLLAKEIDRLG